MKSLRRNWAFVLFAIAVVYAADKLFEDVKSLKEDIASLQAGGPIDASSFIQHGDKVTLRLPNDNGGLQLNPNASEREKQAYIGAPSKLVVSKSAD